MLAGHGIEGMATTLTRRTKIVEDIVAPSIRRLAGELFDCGEQQYFATRVVLKRSDDPSREREFDALYVGADAVLLNETKSTPRTEYVREFVRSYAHLPVRHSAGHGEVPDAERRLRDRDGRRSHAGAQPAGSAQPARIAASATDCADARGSRPRLTQAVAAQLLQRLAVTAP